MTDQEFIERLATALLIGVDEAERRVTSATERLKSEIEKLRTDNLDHELRRGNRNALDILVNLERRKAIG